MNKNEVSLINDLKDKGYRSYKDQNIVVYWNPQICQHKGLCVKSDAHVFDPNRKPWILLENCDSEKIANAIDKCPSGALKYAKNTNNTLNNEIDAKNRDGSTIEIKFSLENKRAFALFNNEEIGEITFSPSDKLWIIDHTDVNRDFKGQNIGEKLVNAIVSQARELNIKILALCPFAKHLMTKDDSYKDVLN